MMRRHFLCGLLWLLSSLACADVPLEAFLADAFAGTVPPARMLWLTPPLKEQAIKVLEHPYSGLRVKYWQAGKRTAWVLDEIGKERPITIAVVVEEDRVVNLQVLAFRESRGGEVRQGFFTRQFKGAALKEANTLDRPVDGITGATLSVRAVTKVAQLALVFHREVTRAD